MSQKLTDAVVRSLAVPATGNVVAYDGGHRDAVAGFGCRVTASGKRAFILNYRTRSGRERRYTIGQFPDWTTSAARDHAGDLKAKIRGGYDPLAELEGDREAKTIADLCDRFEEEFLPKKRPATQRDYGTIIRKWIRPDLRHKKVAELEFSDIDALHRKVTKSGATYNANRTVAVLSKMLTLAVQWHWRADNPARGIERNHEEKRQRYLSTAELARLIAALNGHADQEAANIVRLLLLTGARRGEVLAARWDQFDLQAGVWTKPGSTTKQKTTHRVPLSAPARLLLVAIHDDAVRAAAGSADGLSAYVFPGRGSDHRVDIKRPWRKLCLEAGIVTSETVVDARGRERVVLTPSARLHDLRHTFASILASAGMSLPIIGALLGHSQQATTARYAHLMEDPLRRATESVGALVMPSGEGADVIEMRGAGR